MKLKDWLRKWKMTSLKINAQFLELELNFNDADKKAAWEMYVELLTRITTQPLKDEDGDEKAALSSVHSIFPITREILKKNGIECIEFSKIAIIILNQKIRPFTAKWHRKLEENEFDKKGEKVQFRKELKLLQNTLRNYNKMLSDIIGIEDLTELEK